MSQAKNSESFELIIIDTVIKEFESKYNFFKCDKIENMLYSGGINTNMGKNKTKINLSLNFLCILDRVLNNYLYIHMPVLDIPRSSTDSHIYCNFLPIYLYFLNL